MEGLLAASANPSPNDTTVSLDALATVEVQDVPLTDALLERFELSGQVGAEGNAKHSQLVFTATAQADNVELGGFDFGAGVTFSGSIENLALADSPVNLRGSVSLEEVSGHFCAPIGTLLEVCGSGTIQPNSTPQIVLDEISVHWSESAPEILEGVTFAAGGLGIDLDGRLYLMNGAFIRVEGGKEGIAQRLGLPSWIPIDVTAAELRFENSEGNRIAPPGENADPIPLDNSAHVILVVSGGIRNDPQIPLRGSFQELEIDLNKLVHGQFPIRNLGGFSIDVEPFEFLEGTPVKLGGGLGFGTIDVDGTSVMYGRLSGHFQIDTWGFGAELIISEVGPVLARLQVPLGIPLDPAGMIVLSGVEGGIAFGQGLVPDVEDPRELIDSDDLVHILDLSDDQIRQALADAEQMKESDNDYTTWKKPFTVGLKGTVASVAAPGLANGSLTLAYNVGFPVGEQESNPVGEQEFKLKAIGAGTIDLFSMSFGRVGAILDLDDPLDPRFDLAFRAPAPGNPLGFLLPAAGELIVSAQAGGLFKVPLLAIRDLAGELLDELDDLDDQAKEAIAAAAQRYFRLNPDSLLGRAIKGLPEFIGGGQEGGGEEEGGGEQEFDLNSITGEDLFSALQQLLPGAADADWNLGEYLQEILPFFYFLAEHAQSAVPDLISRITERAANKVNDVFDHISPSFELRGMIQPTILGFLMGEPTDEVRVSFEKREDGNYTLDFGLTTSLVASMRRQADLISSGTGGLLVDVLTQGAEDRLHFDAQIEIPTDAVQAMLSGQPTGDYDTLEEQLIDAINPFTGWEVLIGGQLFWNGFEIGQIDGILFDPQDRDGDGLPDDENSLFSQYVVNVDTDGDDVIDPDEVHEFQNSGVDSTTIPVYRTSQYEASMQYGGLLLTGQLNLPRIVMDPVSLLQDLPDLPEVDEVDFSQPLEALVGLTEIVDAYVGEGGYIPTLIDTLMQEQQLGALQLYLPSPATLFEGAFNEPEDVVAAGSSDILPTGLGEQFKELLEAFYLEGYLDVQLMSLDLGKATVSATAAGLEVEASSPLLAGLSTRFGLGWQQASAGDVIDLLVSSPLADVALPDGMDAERFGAFLKMLANQAALSEISYPVASWVTSIDSSRIGDMFNTFVDAGWMQPPVHDPSREFSAQLELYTPGYQPNAPHPFRDVLGDRVPEIDPIKRGGGIRLSAQASLAGLVDDAALLVEAQPFGFEQGSSFVLPYFTAYAHIDELNIPGLTAGADILALDAMFFAQKDNNSVTGELRGTATLLDTYRFDVTGDLQLDDSGTVAILGLQSRSSSDQFPLDGELLLLLNSTDEDESRVWDGTSINLPANSGRIHADGTLMVGPFAADGQFDLTVNPQRLAISGSGEVDLGPLGSLDGSGELVMLPGSPPVLAGTLQVGTSLDVQLGIFPIAVDGRLAVEANTTTRQVVLPSGTVMPAGPYYRLAITGPDGSGNAQVILFPAEEGDGGALVMDGRLLAVYRDDELLVEGNLGLNVLDGLVTATVQTVEPIRFMRRGIEGSFRGTLTAAGVELLNATASLDRFGCFRIDVWPGFEYALVDGACEPWAYLPEERIRVNEGAGEVSIPVRLSEPLDEDVTVSVSFGASETKQVTFSEGQTHATVTFTFTNDNTPEFDEDVTVTLSLPEDSPLRTGSPHNRMTVTIEDDDCPDGVVVAQGRCEVVWQDPVLIDVEVPGGDPGTVRTAIASSDLGSFYGVLPGSVGRGRPRTTILDLTATEVDDEPVRLVARRLNPGDEVQVRYAALRYDPPGLYQAQFGEDYVIGSGVVMFSRATFDDPADVAIPIGSLVADSIYEMPEKFRILLEIVKPVAERDGLPDHADPAIAHALRQAADRDTTLRAKEAHITIANDDPERPDGAVVFYNFDLLANDNESSGGSGTDNPFVFTTDADFTLAEPAQVYASPLTHSRQVPEAAAGVDKIPPEPILASPSWGASANRHGVPAWYDPETNADNLIANGSFDATGDTDAGDIPGWSVQSGNWQVLGVGQTMIWAGPAPREGVAILTQEIDVSHLAGGIDEGTVAFQFSGLLRSKLEIPGDRGRIVIRYRDADGADLETFDSNWLTSPWSWREITDERVAPTGTRSIQIELWGRRETFARFAPRFGSPNFPVTGTLQGHLPSVPPAIDVYFDDLRLTAVPHYAPSYFEFTVALENTRDIFNDFTDPSELSDLMVLSITGLDFWDYSASTSPAQWRLRSSLDDYQTVLASGMIHAGEFGHHVQQPISGLTCLTPQQLPVTFRLERIGEDNQTWTIDNLALLGSVHPASACEQLEPPQAVDDSVRTAVDTSVSGNVLANDVLGSAPTAIVQLAGGPSHGTLQDGLSSDGSFVYVPAEGFGGEDQFSYYLVTEFGYSEATVTITVSRPPVAVGDAYGTEEDNVLRVSAPGVLGNDDPVDSDTLTSRLVSGPSHGTLVLNDDGSFEYTPETDFSGEDRFTYVAVASDGQQSDPAVVVINVTEVNDPPRLTTPRICIDEDTRFFIDLNTLVTDPETSAEELEVQFTVRRMNGRLLPPNKGERLTRQSRSFWYRPTLNFHGEQGLVLVVGMSDGEHRVEEKFTVCVTPVNDPPWLQSDLASTPQNTSVTIPVLNNDRDVDGDTISVVSVTSSQQGGSVQINPDGTVTYTPPVGFAGSDRFYYTATDGLVRRSTSVVVEVEGPPVAVDDSYSVSRGQTLTVAAPGVLANDSDPNGDPLTAALVTMPSHGTLELQPDGSFTYTHDGSNSTSDSFTYRAVAGGADDLATVTIVIQQINTAPVAGDTTVTIRPSESVTIDLRQFADDQETDDAKLRFQLFGRPSRGTATLEGPMLTYVPSPSFNAGKDRFKYRVFDTAGASDSGLITIQVVQNSPPDAASDAIFAGPGISVGNVLGNDSDADGDSLTAELVAGPSLGTVNLQPDGSFTYTAPSSFSDCETTSFTYRVDDGWGGTDTAEVSITLRHGPGACGGGTVGGTGHGGNGTISRGYTAEAFVFLDANRNGVHDFLDRNGNGMQDDDEPSEPATVSQGDGSFVLPLDPNFDSNSNGQYDAADGLIVVFGGMDLATGQPLHGVLSAPADSTILSPWTTLVTAVWQHSQGSVEDAVALVRQRFNLAELDLMNLDPLGATLQGTEGAPRAFEQGSMVYETLTQLSQALSTWSDIPLLVTHNTVLSSLAQQVAAATGPVDLSDPATIADLLDAASRVLDVTLPPAVASAAVNVVAAVNQAIGSYGDASGLEFLQRISAVESVAQSTLIAAWSQLSAGQLTAEQFEGEFSGQGLQEKLATAVPGVVEPVEVSIQEDVVLPLTGDWPRTIQLEVVLSQVSPFDLLVPWSTVDRTAQSDDYDAAHGLLRFPAGETTATISINVHPDVSDQRTRSFSVVLGDPQGGVIADGEALVVLEGAANEHDVLQTSWHNLSLAMDVNDDQAVSPIDALIVINALNRDSGPRRLDHATEPTSPPYVDVTGDGWLTPLDALIIINFLNSRGPGGEGELAHTGTSVIAAPTVNERTVSLQPSAFTLGAERITPDRSSGPASVPTGGDEGRLLPAAIPDAAWQVRAEQSGYRHPEQRGYAEPDSATAPVAAAWGIKEDRAFSSAAAQRDAWFATLDRASDAALVDDEPLDGLDAELDALSESVLHDVANQWFGS